MTIATSEGRAALAAQYRDGLLNDVIPFWLKHGLDREHGGIMTGIDADGTVIDTDKGLWQQCRFCWMMGELYNTVEPREEWLEAAKSTLAFIERHGFDPADGRMWFHVTREGAPIRKRRYAVTESFAAIAYGEMAKALGSDEYAAKATACFDRFVRHRLGTATAPKKFTDTRPVKALGGPMIAIVTAQELRDSIGFDALPWIEQAIHTIRTDHVKPGLEAVLELVGPNGAVYDHADGRTLNPGHAIEGAWFILAEGKHRGDPSLVELGLQMLDYTWRRGWDAEHGGILYFTDLKGLPVSEYWHDMKFWWPHNEAVIATILAHQLTGDTRYAEWHGQVHDWAYAHFPDREHGEWFGYLHRDGSVSSRLKGNLWKGPFHLPRMQLLAWKLLEGYPAATQS